MTKENFKLKILNLGIFCDNEWFNKYIDLIYMYKYEHILNHIKHETQLHHIIPKCYYKLNNLEIDNSDENLVELYYKDHILAHCYMTLCSNDTEFMSKNNNSINRVIHSLGLEDKWDLMNSLDIVQYAYSMSKHVSDEQRVKISNSLKGRKLSDDHKLKVIKNLKPKNFLGKHHSNESKIKQSISVSKLKWFNNGEIQIRRVECPEGFVPGRLPVTQEFREKMSLIGKGRTVTDETREKIRSKLKGRKLSDDQKLKLSISLTGRKQSEETRLKRSASLKGRSVGGIKGKHWYTNGDIEIADYICPEGFVNGRLKNN